MFNLAMRSRTCYAFIEIIMLYIYVPKIKTEEKDNYTKSRLSNILDMKTFNILSSIFIFTPCNLKKFSGKLFGNRAPCAFLYNGFSWTFSVNRTPNAPCYRRNPHWTFWVYSPWYYSSHNCQQLHLHVENLHSWHLVGLKGWFGWSEGLMFYFIIDVHPFFGFVVFHE